MAAEAWPQVVALDLARQSLDEAAIDDADLIAIYLPMHTATRLAAQLIPLLRKQNPSAHLCCYGLYAPMNVDYLRALGVSTILGGEFEEELVHLAERLTSTESRQSRRPRNPLSPWRDCSSKCRIDQECLRWRSMRISSSPGGLSDRWFDGSEPRLQASLPALPDRPGL